jgi:hypothetical protein
VLATSYIDPVRSFLTSQNFYSFSRKSGRFQITQRSLGITCIINESNNLVAWIGNEVRLFFMSRCGPCARTFSLVVSFLDRASS